MKRELSSSTWMALAVFATIPLAFFWLVVIERTIRSFFDPDVRSLLALIPILIVFTGIVIWQIIVPKGVCIDSQYLYIQGRKGLIQVPLSEMQEAHYNDFSKTISITLKSPSEYGQEIVFHPRELALFGRSKITDELIDIIVSSENRGHLTHKRH